MPQMFYQLSNIPNREKYNKLCKVCQVILPLVKGVGSLSASVRYLTTTSKASNDTDMATAIRHNTTSTAILTYTSVLNPLLRSPAHT